MLTASQIKDRNFLYFRCTDLWEWLLVGVVMMTNEYWGAVHTAVMDVSVAL